MLWLMNLGLAGSSGAAPPDVAPNTELRVARSSPAAWSTKWRTTGWIRLRPSWAV